MRCPWDLFTRFTRWRLAWLQYFTTRGKNRYAFQEKIPGSFRLNGKSYLAALPEEQACALWSHCDLPGNFCCCNGLPDYSRQNSLRERSEARNLNQEPWFY